MMTIAQRYLFRAMGRMVEDIQEVDLSDLRLRVRPLGKDWAVWLSVASHEPCTVYWLDAEGQERGRLLGGYGD